MFLFFFYRYTLTAKKELYVIYQFLFYEKIFLIDFQKGGYSTIFLRISFDFPII